MANFPQGVWVRDAAQECHLLEDETPVDIPLCKLDACSCRAKLLLREVKYYGTITLFQKSEVCGLGDKIRTAKRNRVHTYDAIGSFGSGTEVVRTDFLHYVTADSVETTRECAPDFGPLVSQAERYVLFGIKDHERQGKPLVYQECLEHAVGEFMMTTIDEGVYKQEPGPCLKQCPGMKLRAFIHQKMAYDLFPKDAPRARLYTNETSCLADDIGSFGMLSDCSASCPEG